MSGLTLSDPHRFASLLRKQNEAVGGVEGSIARDPSTSPLGVASGLRSG